MKSKDVAGTQRVIDEWEPNADLPPGKIAVIGSGRDKDYPRDIQDVVVIRTMRDGSGRLDEPRTYKRVKRERATLLHKLFTVKNWGEDAW